MRNTVAALRKQLCTRILNSRNPGFLSLTERVQQPELHHLVFATILALSETPKKPGLSRPR
jgi:hypothetical protein